MSSLITFSIFISILFSIVSANDLFFAAKKKVTSAPSGPTASVSTANPYPYSMSQSDDSDGMTKSGYGSGATNGPPSSGGAAGSVGSGGGKKPYRYRKGTTKYYMPTIQPNVGYGSGSKKPNPGPDRAPKPAPKGSKPAKGSKPTVTGSQTSSGQSQEQQQQQQEVVNCHQKNKIAEEMERFKERAKVIESKIDSNSTTNFVDLFNADLSKGYEFLIYDFVQLVDQMGRVVIKK